MWRNSHTNIRKRFLSVLTASAAAASQLTALTSYCASAESPQQEFADGPHYEIINESLSWQEAETYCERNGGHLAVITSAEEQEQIEALLQEHLSEPGKNCYWIGLKKSDDGEFSWVTDELLTYTNWTGYYPGNSYEGEDSVFL